tara:strand:+ start:565 stop:822 length:258 start_codon:yes stop_codon:yes gene_type:complete
MPKPLDYGRLKQFERRSLVETEISASVEDTGNTSKRWPSREPVMDGQISIKAPLDTLDRFKRICKDDRRTYADMLRILMDGYEGK